MCQFCWSFQYQHIFCSVCSKNSTNSEKKCHILTNCNMYDTWNLPYMANRAWPGLDRVHVAGFEECMHSRGKKTRKRRTTLTKTGNDAVFIAFTVDDAIIARRTHLTQGFCSRILKTTQNHSAHLIQVVQSVHSCSPGTSHT